MPSVYLSVRIFLSMVSAVCNVDNHVLSGLVHHLVVRGTVSVNAGYWICVGTIISFVRLGSSGR